MNGILGPKISKATTLGIDDKNPVKKFEAVKKWEEIGRIACAKAGYPTKPLFSLSIDTSRVLRAIHLEVSLRDKQNGSGKLTGSVELSEYYDNIPVTYGYAMVGLWSGHVDVVKFEAAGITDAKVEGTKPKYTSDEALKIYLKEGRIVPLEKSQSTLCYFLKNGTLVLCWYYLIFGARDTGSLEVWVNAVTGETMNEFCPDVH